MKSAAYWEAFEGHAEAQDAMEDGKHGARLIIASRIRDTMDQVKNVLGAHPDAKLTARLFYVELIWEAQKLAQELQLHVEQELPAYGEGDAACDRDFHEIYMKELKEDVVMQRVKWLDMDVRKMTDREFQEQWALMKTQILRLTAA